MRKPAWMTVLILLGVVLISCTGQPAMPSEQSPTSVTATDVQRMTVAEARGLLAQDMVRFYDTRAMEEYRALHIAGAHPFPEGEAIARFSELPPDETLVFY